MQYTRTNQVYTIQRYPSTSNTSLKAWSAADEYLLQTLDSLELSNATIALVNDRFGFLACMLHPHRPWSIIANKTQEKALLHNLHLNALALENIQRMSPLDNLEQQVDYALIKIPKSLELFRLYLHQLCKNATEDLVVIGAFMTKYFSPQMIEIAQEFFEEVEQSRAWKKSRLLTLSKVKPVKEISILHNIPFQGDLYQQYFGVFSAKHIDYASQFFVESMQIPATCSKALDLASGNGILAKQVQLKRPDIELHLMDDAYLAVASSKLNVEPQNCYFHYNNTLDDFEDHSFDFIFSNPPFHFEHEVSIDVSTQLFSEVFQKLKPRGQFQLVANRHLNYYTHLIKQFNSVEILAQNKKFIVYNCIK